MRGDQTLGSEQKHWSRAFGAFSGPQVLRSVLPSFRAASARCCFTSAQRRVIHRSGRELLRPRTSLGSIGLGRELTPRRSDRKRSGSEADRFDLKRNSQVDLKKRFTMFPDTTLTCHMPPTLTPETTPTDRQIHQSHGSRLGMFSDVETYDFKFYWSTPVDVHLDGWNISCPPVHREVHEEQRPFTATATGRRSASSCPKRRFEGLHVAMNTWRPPQRREERRDPLT